jgi:hypothetical protein
MESYSDREIIKESFEAVADVVDVAFWSQFIKTHSSLY